MLPDLERLIRLQSLHTTADDARRRIATIPAQIDALDARLDEQRSALDTAKQQLETNQGSRRELEKEVAAVQSRLSKFKEQLMSVKTNKEYQAMQKEIATAEHEVQSFEERILEAMLESDTLAAAVKDAEASLAAAEADIEAERKTIEQERGTCEAAAKKALDAREVLAGEIAGKILGLFDQIVEKRNGVAVVEARDGLCSSCHVHLRPQVLNDVRRNDRLIQCEHCGRILHFDAAAGAQPAADA
ncbi:MAG: C4-type zinc ribbon domain-containing protein [Vicinamibacterales bacterium]|jgi:hypothetical protein|nr:hypothetical protein [Acidobacteriota bacterium]MDP7294040.1 C4-type zinc ribbon domain-containing protein [Vicinamibacterales bacterium]MDP7472436.1 C4-type zinc ribbon domain-containing protein [Vicinamibacterales bacterium]MDP7671099.1 C4-type zinc ribbon domain-containing protein [Vicinamibacterales bacterium]HJO39889.1 C4-type zinc ribbon domain-containing protein [Vicinamibacterales bacterium]|tara:strand:- start:1008 stop:1742 length:735 start_codon:yes stop_codon:yes gene_type:complete